MVGTQNVESQWPDFLFSSFWMLTKITSCRSVAVFQWPPWPEASTQVISNFSKIGKVVVGKFLASLYYMYYTQQVVQHSILLICTVREVEKVNISWQKSHSFFAGESPFGERDDSCFQVKTSILFNNDRIDGMMSSLTLQENHDIAITMTSCI